MAETENEIRARLEKEEKLAAARAAAGDSLLDNAAHAAKAAGDILSDAGKTVYDVASDPAAAAKAAISGTARLATRGVINSVKAAAHGVAQGFSDEVEEPQDLPKQIDAVAAQTASRPMNWLERKKASLDSTVSDLANTKVPLRYRAMWFAASKAVTYWSWAGRTYPHVLRPARYVAHKLRDRLDAKTLEQGKATDWQKLRRKFLSIGPREGFLARARYRAINTFSVVTAASLGFAAAVDGAYSYGTYHQYKDVTITNIFRNPDRTNYVAEVHGYQMGENGKREPIFFEVSWNLFYGNFFPQYTVSDISQGDVCHISTYGSTRRIPLSIRRLFSLNPVIVSADCHRPEQKAGVPAKTLTP